jgi:hypothetical protein
MGFRLVSRNKCSPLLRREEGLFLVMYLYVDSPFCFLKSQLILTQVGVVSWAVVAAILVVSHEVEEPFKGGFAVWLGPHTRQS